MSPFQPTREQVAAGLASTGIMRTDELAQLTLDGREETLPVPAEAQGEALTLFTPDAFAARVPGTLALDVDCSADGVREHERYLEPRRQRRGGHYQL